MRSNKINSKDLSKMSQAQRETLKFAIEHDRRRRTTHAVEVWIEQNIKRDGYWRGVLFCWLGFIIAMLTNYLA